MNPTETLSAPPSFTGHVRNGVVVIDTLASLAEGQAVRIEPLAEAVEGTLDHVRTERVLQVQQLFDQWTREDAQLPLDEADRLHIALEQSRGLTFRSPDLN